jgi:clan AA aspartic protease (TIGR02281 family)
MKQIITSIFLIFAFFLFFDYLLSLRLPIDSDSLDNSFVTINRLQTGMFETMVSINDSQDIPAMVDTGATYLSISESMATQLGINYVNSRQSFSQTANGKIRVYLVGLNSVRIGGLVFNKVLAVVGGDMDKVLIGLSVLSRCNVKMDIDKIVLSKRADEYLVRSQASKTLLGISR